MQSGARENTGTPPPAASRATTVATVCHQQLETPAVTPTPRHVVCRAALLPYKASAVQDVWASHQKLGAVSLPRWLQS